MSGGSYDYFYSKLEDMADSVARSANRAGFVCGKSTPALRRAFAEHLKLCAEACRAIEWNDSGDGDDREAELIRKCVSPDAALKQAIADAQTALDGISGEIALAKEVVSQVQTLNQPAAE